MAAGRTTANNHLDTGSDSVDEFPCTRCERFHGGYTEASRYCPQCQEYFCRSCVQFGCDHGLLGKTDVAQWGIARPKQTMPIIVDCPLHSGDELDFYCNTHDKIMCQICVALHHTTCSLQYFGTNPHYQQNIHHKESDQDTEYETPCQIDPTARLEAQQRLNDHKQPRHEQQGQSSVTNNREQQQRPPNPNIVINNGQQLQKQRSGESTIDERERLKILQSLDDAINSGITTLRRPQLQDNATNKRELQQKPPSQPNKRDLQQGPEFKQVITIRRQQSHKQRGQEMQKKQHSQGNVINKPRLQQIPQSQGNVINKQRPQSQQDNVINKREVQQRPQSQGNVINKQRSQSLGNAISKPQLQQTRQTRDNVINKQRPQSQGNVINKQRPQSQGNVINKRELPQIPQSQGNVINKREQQQRPQSQANVTNTHALRWRGNFATNHEMLQKQERQDNVINKPELQQRPQMLGNERNPYELQTNLDNTYYLNQCALRKRQRQLIECEINAYEFIEEESNDEDGLCDCDDCLKANMRLMNSCIGDIRRLVSRLEAVWTENEALEKDILECERRGQSCKGILSRMRANTPHPETFIDVFQKIKFVFNLTTILLGHVRNLPELIHDLVAQLNIVYEASEWSVYKGRDLAAQAVSPLLLPEARELILDNLMHTPVFLNMWQQLSPSLTMVIGEYEGYVPPYKPTCATDMDSLAADAALITIREGWDQAESDYSDLYSIQERFGGHYNTANPMSPGPPEFLPGPPVMVPGNPNMVIGSPVIMPGGPGSPLMMPGESGPPLMMPGVPVSPMMMPGGPGSPLMMPGGPGLVPVQPLLCLQNMEGVNGSQTVMVYNPLMMGAQPVQLVQPPLPGQPNTK